MVANGEDDRKQPLRSWFCKHERCADCAQQDMPGVALLPDGSTAKCMCRCHSTTGSKLCNRDDADFLSDEVELERSYSHAPPVEIVRTAIHLGWVPREAMDRGWIFRGRHALVSRAQRIKLPCNCRPPHPPEVVELYPLRSGTKTYALGQCGRCGLLLWIEKVKA